MRALCLTSCSGSTQGLSGVAYSPSGAMTEQQAIAHVRSNRRGTAITLTAGEPKWFDVAALPDLTNVLGLANAIVIVNAVSSYQVQLGPFQVSNPLEEIRQCRNFVAHKGDVSMKQAQAAANASFPDMSTHVRTRRSGVETFSEWKESCLAIAEAAAQ